MVVSGWPSDFRPAYMPWLFHQVAALAAHHAMTVLVLESATHYLLHREYWGQWARRWHGPRYFPIEGRDVPIHVARAPVPPGYWLNRSLRFALYRRAAERALARAGDPRFDLVHAHFASPPGAVARALAARRGLPTVLTEHASRFDFLLRTGMDVPGVLRDASAVICVSRGLREAMRPIVAPHEDKLHWIQNGADLSVFRPGAHGTHTPGAPRLLFVGQLIERKGVDVLLRAMHALEARGVRAHLRLVGRGPEEGALRELARSLGLAERVEFAGLVRNEEVAGFYRDCDIAVLPSHAEANPVVVIEALASGTPVVATRCGAEAIVGEAHGVVVEPGDVDALAEAIERVDAGYARYRPDVLAEHARRDYSIESAAERISAVYRSVAGDAAAS